MAKSHVVAKVPSIVSNLLLFGILIATFTTTGAQIGVCYGTLGKNLPTPREIISPYNQNDVKRMRLYCPNNDAVKALRGSNIELMLCVENERLQDIASNQASADDWVQKYVITYGNVNFKYIAVGNELNATGPLAPFVGPAMENIQNAISKAGLANKIKVSIAVYPIILQECPPPSKESFKLDYQPFLDPIISFLVRKPISVVS
ncbi:hypothetical protein M0R45_030613 [Rubus argutus]|uniref:glucan endo-1,3-beta-D-glucosidase n=1 Tax=Rubus argutus TaxID=59490 RepID=A0AAW1WC26_RUBAR